MKIKSIMWNSHVPMLVRAGRKVDALDLRVFSSKTLENDPLRVDDALDELKSADVILLYRSSEGFWEAVENRLRG